MLSSGTLATLAAALFVPIGLVYILRVRPGTARSGAVLVLAVSMALVVGVTLGPLPVEGDFETGLSQGWTEVNLIPFEIVGRYLRDGVDVGLATRELVGNLLLLMPFGFLVPLVSDRARSLGRVLLLALITALVIELLQLLVILTVGNAGRAIDVDDVMLNMVGAGVGYGGYLLLRRLTAARRAPDGAPRRSS